MAGAARQQYTVPGEPGAAPQRAYIHIPFCTTVCPYCAFAVVAQGKQPIPDAWVQTLVQEITTTLQADTWGATWKSIYLGGGTPSLLSASQLERVLAPFQPGIGATTEITLEANVEDIQPAVVRAWQQAGMNRVSVGLQSFVPAVRKALGRGRSNRIPLAEVWPLLQAFPSWSVDLIYGHSLQTAAVWQQELASLQALAPPHVSAYALTIEPQTPYARVRPVQADDRLAGMYAQLLDLSWPLQAYEVSNFCQEGQRARHNSAYWGHDAWYGFGPAAHGQRWRGDTLVRYENLPELSVWQGQVQQTGSGVGTSMVVDRDARQLERIMLGLRCDLGVSLQDLGPQQRMLVDTWVQQGLGQYRDTHFVLDQKEWIRADGWALALAQKDDI